MNKSKLQQTFEANMLDGQDLEDYAGDTLTAWEVFQFIEELVADEIGAYQEWLLKKLPKTRSHANLGTLLKMKRISISGYRRELHVANYAEQVRKIIRESNQP